MRSDRQLQNTHGSFFAARFTAFTDNSNEITRIRVLEKSKVIERGKQQDEHELSPNCVSKPQEIIEKKEIHIIKFMNSSHMKKMGQTNKLISCVL